MGSDPYCRVSAFSTSYTTATIVKTLDPVWNEHVEMTFFNDPKTLRFEVFDWDGNTKDDAIGDCVFKLDPNFYDASNNGFLGKVKLENCKKGELEIKVVARKLLPSVIEQKLSDLQEDKAKNEQTVNENNGQIQELNDKKLGIENEINALNANINGLQNEKIPNAQNELKQARDEGVECENEKKAMDQNIKDLEVECNDLAKESDVLLKELENIKVAEDKKRTENEHLRSDIKDLKIQIKEKKEKEERDRMDRENAEKERLKKEENESKTEEEKPSDIRVDPPRKESSENDPNSPLVNKNKRDDDSQACACCVVL